jgi:glutaredoxin 3
MSEPAVKVIVYSAPWCVYCRMAKEYFRGKNVAFSEIDVDQDPDAARKIFEKTGQAGVPVIEIGDETIMGFDRPRIDLALRHFKLI